MKQYIKFDSVEDVEKFVDLMGKYEFDADLSAGRFCVDAKSILGIISMGLKRTLILMVHGENEMMRQELSAFAE